MSKPHFPWNPCRSQNMPNKRCKPWVLCVRNLCSQIIKWYLIDTQWPLIVYIVSKDRTLPQPFVWRVVGTRIVFGCCLHFFGNNVSNPECSSFPQRTFSNKFINTCLCAVNSFSVPRANWFLSPWTTGRDIYHPYAQESRVPQRHPNCQQVHKTYKGSIDTRVGEQQRID